ncbi:hypothetical protein AK830_g2122 [Neonectria ditissima]|uniref:F-box domain-containing protein n=1 Tax=Neonectria ditissima TaxID=78410 RepID=A0A0P7BX33_9HYPO|nr:hypothetical protein AK830_g2122 [Neonectria ditissima]
MDAPTQLHPTSIHMAQELTKSSVAAPARNRILALPLELIFMISNQLPSHSHVALALAAKALFVTFYPTGKVPALGENLVQLLVLLERDDPTQIVCFDCHRLCAFNSRQAHMNCVEFARVKWQPVITDQRWRMTRRRCPKRCRVYSIGICKDNCNESKVHPLAWMPEIRWPVVTFAEAHLVMNRHRNGEPYGLPLDSLEYSFVFERFIDVYGCIYDTHFPLDRHPQGRQYLTRERRRTALKSPTLNTQISTLPWSFKHISKAKVIDNELYLARFHSVNSPPISRLGFCHVLDTLELPICRHGSSYCSIPAICPYRAHYWCISQLRSFRTGEKGHIKESRSCPTCFTDFSIVLQGNKLTGWNLELATYHRLGSCWTPDDPIWQDTIGEARYPVIGKPRLEGDHGDSNPGEVTSRWQQSSGEVLDQDAKWVTEIGALDQLLW